MDISSALYSNAVPEFQQQVSEFYASLKILKLSTPIRLIFQTLLSLPINPIIGIKLLLQLDNSFIPFIKPRSQSNHNTPLPEQQLFTPINPRYILFNLRLSFSIPCSLLSYSFLTAFYFSSSPVINCSISRLSF